MRAAVVCLLTCLLTPAFAQMVEVTDQGETKTTVKGAQKMREYLLKRKGQKPTEERAPAQDSVGGAGAPRYLAIHVGTFFDDQAYKWGHGDQTDIGRLNAGVTYRMGEWVNSMDLLFRGDFMSYDLDESAARKLSFSALITFPDANSRFPLYFGAGLGAGIFIKQVDKESSLSLDYSILGGARFFDVFESVGLMAEIGMKNHLLLLSDGQFNGVFINVGTIFSF